MEKFLVTPKEFQLKMRSKKDLYYIFKHQGEHYVICLYKLLLLNFWLALLIIEKLVGLFLPNCRNWHSSFLKDLINGSKNVSMLAW